MSWVHRLGVIAAIALVFAILPVSAASAAPNADTCPPVIHVVQRGETLYRIATHYRVTVQAIVAANGIVYANVIYAGRQLVIPGAYCPPSSPPPSGCYTFYTVRPGDTLTRIAYRYGTTVNNLVLCNAIADPNRIYIGQTLCICGGAGSLYTP